MPKLTSCTSRLYVIAALVALVSLPGARVRAQDRPQQEQQSQRQDQQQLSSQKEIQQLVAPIALYPDALLAQVLTASTYPLEVTMAARWSEKNRKVKGEALQDAMQKQPWDPSVKGLTSVPQVLSMMNDKLDWTSRLGEAFLAQPDDVQKAVQTLRAQAEATGNLKSTKEQRVRRVAATPSPGYVGPPEYLVIEPIEEDYIYVPIYNPTIVFGLSYWEPAYVPFFRYPPWWTVGEVFGFGPALFVGPALWYGFSWDTPDIQPSTSITRITANSTEPITPVVAGSSILLTGRWDLRIRTFNSSSGRRAVKASVLRASKVLRLESNSKTSSAERK